MWHKYSNVKNSCILNVICNSIIYVSMGLIILFIVSCSSGSSSTPSPGTFTPLPPPTSPNMLIQVTPNFKSSNTLCGRSVNIPCVSLTICVPNTTTCATISDVLLDTGSYGLRIFDTAIPDNIASQLILKSSGSLTVYECVQYGDSSANFGPLATADIQFTPKEVASNTSFQVISANANINPQLCSGARNINPQTFGVNGILGVGPLATDSTSGTYYLCNSNTCFLQSLKFAESNALPNPITLLATPENNGITIKLPSLNSINGAIGVYGYAVFGVGTNIDNTPPSAIQNYTVRISCGGCGLPISMVTQLNGTSFSGFVDTGSNGLFFNAPTIEPCSSTFGALWYCPRNPITLNPSNTNAALESVPTIITISNAEPFFSNNVNSASANLGANAVGVNWFDFGLPFFFGKTVYNCFQGKTCQGVNEGTQNPTWSF